MQILTVCLTSMEGVFKVRNRFMLPDLCQQQGVCPVCRALPSKLFSTRFFSLIYICFAVHVCFISASHSVFTSGSDANLLYMCPQKQPCFFLHSNFHVTCEPVASINGDAMNHNV